jgi:phage terminase small subunit
VRPGLLAWQWSDYAAKHCDHGNLLLHIVMIPLFQLATLVLLYGLVTLRPVTAVAGAAGMLVSIVAQGRGHRRERETPTPFDGAGDAMSRLLVEQWVTFPWFVLSGGWARNLRASR